MATNAYTNLTPSQFNPLSLEEIMMVPLARQHAHDKSSAEMAELAMFDTKRLQQDDAEARRLHADYMNRIQGAENELLEKGFNSGITKSILELKREREQAMSQDGWHGKMENAYAQDQALQEYFAKNKNINPDDAQKYLNYSRQNYKGYEDGYNPYYGANSINIQKRGEEILKQIPPQTIKSLAFKDGWTELPDGTWRNGEIITKELPAEYIQQAVSIALQSDSEVMAYVNALSQSTGQDYSPLINRAAYAASAIGQIKDRSETQEMKFGLKMKGDGEEGFDESRGLNYNVVKSFNEELFKKNNTLNDTLGKIIIGDKTKERLVIDFERGFNALTQSYYKKKDPNSGKPYTLDNISEEDRKELQEIADGLSLRGILKEPNGKIITNPSLEINIDGKKVLNKKALESVLEYRKKYDINPASSFMVEMNDLSGNVANYNTGMKTVDHTTVLNQANSDRLDQLFITPDGKVVNYSELIEDKGGDGKIKMVSGYVDVGNNLPDIVKKSKYSDKSSSFVSPLVVQMEDKNGNTFKAYMTRNDGQQRTARYNTDVKTNEIIMKGRKMPLVPQKVKINGKEKLVVYRDNQDIMREIDELVPLLLQQGNKFKDFDIMNEEEKRIYEYVSELQEKVLSAGPKGGIFEIAGDNEKSMIFTQPELQDFMYRNYGVKNY